MPSFDDASTVESTTYQMRLADFPRSRQRARVNDLMNGSPPYTPEEQAENKTTFNVNFLEGPRIAHDARAQFYSNFLKAGHYFTVHTDMGPVHKRAQRGAVVTREINRILKQSLAYYECFRSKFASNVLHGIGPSAQRDRFRWCPRMVAIDDVLIPGGTELIDIADNSIPHFAIYNRFTMPQLQRLTQMPRSRVDKGWNMGLVNALLDQLDEESQQIVSTEHNMDIWLPERAAERRKSNGNAYAGDWMPTVPAYDFYFFDDAGKNSGWRRRIILDAWANPAASKQNRGATQRKKGKAYDMAKTQFLYDGGNRKYAASMSEIINFQFADLSAVSPFRYHSVRSLGWLLYGICQLQNRLRCQFTESVFETLMMLLRVDDEDDLQHVLNITLANRKVLDSKVKFIPANERWNPNHQLVQLGLNENAQIISQHVASNVTGPPNVPDGRRITATQFLGEVQKTTQLVSASIMQAHEYQLAEYREIFRRFMIQNSPDPDVNTFRARCLKHDVPPEMLDAGAWDIEPERVMGAGNKTLELAIADKLLELMPRLDPEPARMALRGAVLAYTDDPDKTAALVPEQPEISDAIHHAQLAAGTLMQNLSVAIKSGINRVEYIQTLMVSMAEKIDEIANRDNVGTEAEIRGLARLASHIGENIAILAQDENEQQRVKLFGDQLGQLMNLVKAFAQRFDAQRQAQGQGVDAKTAVSLQAEIIKAEAKAANMRESHAKRTAQRQVQFEQGLYQKQVEHQQKLMQDQQKAMLELDKANAKNILDT